MSLATAESGCLRKECANQTLFFKVDVLNIFRKFLIKYLCIVYQPQILLIEKVAILKWARGGMCRLESQTSYKKRDFNLWISCEEKEMITYVKSFRINNVHTLFNVSKSKRVWRNNIFFYRIFTGKLHCISPAKLSTWRRMNTQLCLIIGSYNYLELGENCRNFLK